MALQVSGKTALVTGGGSGICLEFAKLLLTNNCNVVIADLTLLPEAEELIKSTTSTTDGNADVNGGAKTARAIFQKTDVTDWKQLEDAFKRAQSEFGGLDVVCPGAGIFEPNWSSFWYPNSKIDTPDTSSYKTIEINVTHPIRATQLALDVYKRQGYGVVLLIASIAAQLPLLPVPLYAASKAAISSFTRSLGPLEPHSNIRVSAVAPAIVKTPIWPVDRAKWVDENVDTWITPERIARVMLDVVQDEQYVGGTVLEIGLEMTRRVEGVGDPGPDMGAKGYGVSRIMEGVVGTFGLLERNFGK